MSECKSAVDDIQPEEWIADVLLSLREGDEVYINGRDRPFTVESREWDDRESGYWRYTLSGYGTEYGGVVDPGKKHTEKSVSSFTTNAGSTIFPVKAERDPEGDQIVSDTRADEWLAEAGIDVR
ncbi:hypothetical protein [Natronorubrum sp. DTA7]|uniref:hypothetical protein n=1 Tax=Natronorubrum sp. DTA7 TaxID=3447016 RepID=UPI003F83FE9E